jgi:hypothetical protein
MNTYTFTFFGRQVGAIGSTHHDCVAVQAGPYTAGCYSLRGSSGDRNQYDDHLPRFGPAS